MNDDEARLKHLAALNTTITGSEARPYVALDNIESWAGGLVPDAALEIREPGDGSGIASVEPGDVLFGKLRPYLAKTWVADRPAYASTELLCLRPEDGVDSRWLGYVSLSQPFVQWAVATSDGTKMPRTSWEKLGSYRLRPLRLAEQRAIADFLDAETARIDALIGKKRRLAEVLNERRSALISQMLWAAPFSLVRLRHMAGRPTSGNRDHSSFTFSEEGVPCLRGINIRPGKIVMEDLLLISADDHERHATTALDPGDLVIVRSGLAGSAVAIPDDFGSCNCVDLVVVKRTERMVPRYLEYVVNSRDAQEQVKARSAGALLQHFNAVDAGDLQIPWREMDQQRDVVVALDEACERLDRLTSMLERHIHLLAERRQALITVAITGELDVARTIAEVAS